MKARVEPHSAAIISVDFDIFLKKETTIEYFIMANIMQ